MPRLELEAIRYDQLDPDYFADAEYTPVASNTINLNSYVELGKGVQAIAGLSGLGLPPVDLRSIASTEGSIYRGKRVQERDIDLPLDITASNRNELKNTLSKLAFVLEGECVLRIIEDDESYWFARVYRSGGGSYAYGSETDGETYMRLVLTLRAHSPYMSRGGSYVASDSGEFGLRTIDTLGDAPVSPMWIFDGPLTAFRVTQGNSHGTGLPTFWWQGDLPAGKSIYVDVERNMVRRVEEPAPDQSVNVYDGLMPAPHLFKLPPRISNVYITVAGESAATRLRYYLRPRKNLVI